MARETLDRSQRNRGQHPADLVADADAARRRIVDAVAAGRPSDARVTNLRCGAADTGTCPRYAFIRIFRRAHTR
jgi:hypothetical protein